MQRVYQTFPALTNPLYRGYFIGQLVSMTGGFMQSVALSWYAYRVTGSAFVLGLMAFCLTLPSLIISPLAGVLADRTSRRNLLITAQLAMAAQATTLFVIVYLNRPGLSDAVWLLLFLALWNGVAAAVEIPVRHSIYAEMFEDRTALPNAISLNAVAMNSSRMLGPAIGGVVIAHYGEAACFAINALSFSLIVLMLLRLPAQNRHASTSSEQSVIASLQEGVRYARANRPIRTLLLLLMMVSTVALHFGNIVPVLVKEVFAGGSTLYGNFMACVGIGSMIAAIRLALRKNVAGLTRLILLANVLAIIALLTAAWSSWAWLTAIALAGLGFSMIATVATVNVVLQSLVDDDKRARVMSLHTAAVFGTATLGNLSLGWLAEHVGIRWTFTYSAVAMLAVTIWFTIQRKHMRVEMRNVYQQKGMLPTIEK